jgi:flagellar biosynthesis protein FlhF
MNVKMYRARSLHEALEQVRRELGPDAAVLETREIQRGWLTGWFSPPRVEVTASKDVSVPSRFERQAAVRVTDGGRASGVESTSGWSDFRDVPSRTNSAEHAPLPAADAVSYRDQFRKAMQVQHKQTDDSETELFLETRRPTQLPESLFQLYARLVEAEVPETISQELVQAARGRCSPSELENFDVVFDRLLQLIEGLIPVRGPIQVNPGKRRVVALVGPTGVGKTTTIAKLAANFRLKEKHQVGLITVDTYRIAAVEQLRTYADIIDLPMEVVSTPREMREAVQRLAHMDLVLIDTAGRSPRDEVRIQELRALLTEAGADEIHLVLSAVSGASGLRKTVEHFAPVGATSMVLSKLDEALSLGALFPFLRDSQLPISYVTDGQNVPDDIHGADRRQLTRYMLRMESV